MAGDGVIGLQSGAVFLDQVADGGLAVVQSIDGFELASFLLFEVGQLEPGHAQDLGLEALANKLAANPDSGEIRPRWTVTYQVRIVRVLPEDFGFLWVGLVFTSFHTTSIKSEYQIVHRRVGTWT
jgi:hypothetical protein